MYKFTLNGSHFCVLGPGDVLKAEDIHEVYITYAIWPDGDSWRAAKRVGNTWEQLCELQSSEQEALQVAIRLYEKS